MLRKNARPGPRETWNHQTPIPRQHHLSHACGAALRRSNRVAHPAIHRAICVLQRTAEAARSRSRHCPLKFPRRCPVDRRTCDRHIAVPAPRLARKTRSRPARAPAGDDDCIVFAAACGVLRYEMRPVQEGLVRANARVTRSSRNRRLTRIKHESDALHSCTRSGRHPFVGVRNNRPERRRALARSAPIGPLTGSEGRSASRDHSSHTFVTMIRLRKLQSSAHERIPRRLCRIDAAEMEATCVSADIARERHATVGPAPLDEHLLRHHSERFNRAPLASRVALKY